LESRRLRLEAAAKAWLLSVLPSEASGLRHQTVLLELVEALLGPLEASRLCLQEGLLLLGVHALLVQILHALTMAGGGLHAERKIVASKLWLQRRRLEPALLIWILRC
jgi:hypothetical protein